MLDGRESANFGITALNGMEISKAKIGKYSLLRYKKYRVSEGAFIVQGEKCVKDTLHHFELKALIIKKGRAGEIADEIGLPKEKRNLILEATMEDIKKISTLENAPEVLAIYKLPKDSGLSLDADPKKFHIVLDGVQDPGNLGTIIRTAHWFGINTIYCSKDTVDVYNPKTVLSSMGSISEVRIEYCALEELFERNRDIPVYVLDLQGDNIYKKKYFAPGFILMGSEGHGPSNIAKKYATEKLTIPSAEADNHPDSLNVSIATAIVLSIIYGKQS